MTKLVYFAWVRERIGLSDEDVVLPDSVATIDDLKSWLAARGPAYAHAFQNASVIRVALDRKHAGEGQTIDGAREIAFFPPMTGG